MTESAPTGEVTLVFTGVDDATALWERSPGVMRAALRVQDRVLRGVLAEQGGYEVKAEGDAFLVAFPDPVAAVRFTLEAQVALEEARWPDELERVDEGAAATGVRGLRVRMGLHAGRPECRVDTVTGRMDYFGPVVNRAARIAAAARGGQVLVSDTVWSAVRGRVEAVATPLGEHRLKGLERPEPLVQLLPPEVAHRQFPPPRTLDAPRSNVRPPASPIVDRREEGDLLARRVDDRPGLATVTGPPGIGKSRLVQEVASAQMGSSAWTGGVWKVDLQGVAQPEVLAVAVADALWLPRRRSGPPEELVRSVGEALALEGRMLLVLDPFEALVEHARQTVGQWMRQAPEASFLVASGERLRVEGESVTDLGPLGEEASVALARQHAPGLNDEAARALVAGLDGVPLAILEHAEVVAAGGAPVSRLDPAGRPSRLRRALDRVWARLAPWEQETLARCATLPDGFTLDAAEDAVQLTDPRAPWILDVVQALADKSLLHTTTAEGRGDVRFELLGPVRAYAEERLAELG